MEHPPSKLENLVCLQHISLDYELNSCFPSLYESNAAHQNAGTNSLHPPKVTRMVPKAFHPPLNPK